MVTLGAGKWVTTVPKMSIISNQCQPLWSILNIVNLSTSVLPSMREWDQYAYTTGQYEDNTWYLGCKCLFLCLPWFHTHTDHTVSTLDVCHTKKHHHHDHHVPGVEITSLPTCHTLNATVGKREQFTFWKRCYKPVHFFKSGEAVNNIYLRWHLITSSEIETTFCAFICMVSDPLQMQKIVSLGIARSHSLTEFPSMVCQCTAPIFVNGLVAASLRPGTSTDHLHQAWHFPPESHRCRG